MPSFKLDYHSAVRLNLLGKHWLLTRSHYPFISIKYETQPRLFMAARSLNSSERFLENNQTLNHAESKRVLALSSLPIVVHQTVVINATDAIHLLKQPNFILHHIFLTKISDLASDKKT